VPAAGRRVRGALVVWLNDRGALNLVNELPLEQYLRGVVPRELGPGSYPELEALKAQAVAARSYTLRNLGGFADEGYDLCSTPKCQVYGGVAAEHPLSDRAVAETAGEILVYAGEPIEALYSATCGGHTEDVETIFPLKREPYLRGVRCVEAGVARLPAPPAVQPRAELLAALAAAGARLERRAARFDDLRAGDLLVRELGAERGYRIERATATYRQSGEGDDGVRSQPLLLAPGDALRLDFAEGRLAAVTQIALAPGAGPERPHQRAAWTRFKTDVEIAASVRLRVPGFEFAGLDVVARGISGRVGRVRLIGRDRSTVEIAGLAVRWALDLPDTWFTVRRTRERGRAGWRFAGRGWGHGVGLCQVGSYAMARRGHDYRTILRHYYTGAVFETLAAGAGDPASSAAASRSAGAQP
jgi:peptidoglycan hydrolase-like amidase